MQVGFLTHLLAPPSSPGPGLPAQHPLKSSSVSQTAWGGVPEVSCLGSREGAERGKEEGAASSHKRLQRARASAKPASTDQRTSGAWTPGPAPALRPRPFILGLPPGTLGSPGEGRGFPCSPGSCHPRREPGNASASCPAATGRRLRRPTPFPIRLSARRGSGLSCGFQGLGAGKKCGSRMGKLRLKVGST